MTTMKQVNFRAMVNLPEDLYKAVDAAAAKTAQTKAATIRAIVAEWASKQSRARALTGAERKALTA